MWARVRVRARVRDGVRTIFERGSRDGVRVGFGVRVRVKVSLVIHKW